MTRHYTGDGFCCVKLDVYKSLFTIDCVSVLFYSHINEGKLCQIIVLYAVFLLQQEGRKVII